jgi:hypothetical protein
MPVQLQDSAQLFFGGGPTRRYNLHQDIEAKSTSIDQGGIAADS